MTRFWQMFVKLVDLKSGLMKSTEAIVKEGNWRFIQLGNYTQASPLVINTGVKTKLTWQASDVSYSDGNGLDVSYDYVNQKFVPTTERDVYLAELRFKCIPSANNGHLDVMLESPSSGFNPINASTSTFVRGMGQVHFESKDFVVFIGADVLANGIEVWLTPNSTNVSIYDVSFLTTRISSGK